ncbi:MAG TPA: radical SAM protein [bacterium]|nr:radical SAM protein [bacterium]
MQIYAGPPDFSRDQRPLELKQSAPIYLVHRGTAQTTLPLVGPPPFGILYVGGALQKAGYPVRIFHLHGPDERPLLDAVQEQRPLFVGISNFLSPGLKPDIKLSRKLRGMGLTVVWGGIFTTCLPETVLESDAVDYVVAGEGEVPIVALAGAITNREPPKKIPGVGYRENNELKIEPPEKPRLDLDDFPLGMDLIDWSPYVHADKLTSTTTVHIPFSRGCPFRCAFCYNNMNPNRQKWRAHGAEYMRDVLSWLGKRHGVNNVYLLCDNPFGKVDAARKIIEDMKTRWMTVAHLGVVNSEFMDWALAAGATRLGIGLESGSDRVLKMLNKMISPEEILDKMLMCGGKKMFTHSGWMGILPGETRDDLARTVRLMDEIHQGNKNHGFSFNIFRAYPFTPLWQKSVEMGMEEPRTLDQWGDFNPQINKILGISDRRAGRMKTMMSFLFPFYRDLDRRLPPAARKILIKRAANAGYFLPVEGSLRMGYRAFRSARKILPI